MEPLLVPEGSRHRTGLTDLAVELAARSAGFRRSLPEGVVSGGWSSRASEGPHSDLEEEIRVGTLRSKSGKILEAVLYRGEVAAILGTSGRQAR